MLNATTKRSCGECHACCIYLEIDVLDKPARQKCRHLGDSGCDIYAERPRVCSGFWCCWAFGLFSVEDRPDRSGVLVHVTTNQVGGMGLEVIECRDGAVEQNDDIVSKCRSVDCRLVTTRYCDGREHLYSRDRVWIDDLIAKNDLPLPPHVHEVDIEVSANGDARMSVSTGHIGCSG